MSISNTIESLVLLAQKGGQPGGGSAFLLGGWLPLVAIGILFYFMLIRPERTKRAELKKMVDQLEKNDRILTIGGIYGTVVNVQQGSEDITIRVDENTNTRLRILRSSVSTVLSGEGQGGEKKGSA